jgi:hypothetical protein
MLTRKEPYNAERLLPSTGILSYNMDSNWENGSHYDIGRRIETPFMNMTYRSTRQIKELAQTELNKRKASRPNIMEEL